MKEAHVPAVISVPARYERVGLCAQAVRCQNIRRRSIVQPSNPKVLKVRNYVWI